MGLKIAVVAFAAVGGVALTSTAVSAMPNGLTKANEIIGQTSNMQQARWVADRRHIDRRHIARRSVPRWRGAVAWGPNRAWRPGWRGAYAWGTPPGWGAQPMWGARDGAGIAQDGASAWDGERARDGAGIAAGGDPAAGNPIEPLTLSQSRGGTASSHFCAVCRWRCRALIKGVRLCGLALLLTAIASHGGGNSGDNNDIARSIGINLLGHKRENTRFA